MLQDAGYSVYTAVRNLDDSCDRLPEARGWDGPAHRAATAMFRRATDTSSEFSHHAEAVANALGTGAGTIGYARSALLTHADEVDRGELSVNEMWVVLIKPARVSAEKAAMLEEQAKAEQLEINRLLTAVGDADSRTASQIQSAAEKYGLSLPGPDDPRNLDPNSGLVRPADEVPDPMTLNGLIQQGVVRASEWRRQSERAKSGSQRTGRYVRLY